MYTTYTPLLYSKSWVYGGIPIFLIFDPSILVGISLVVPTINVLSKNIKNIELFPMKFSFFTAEKKICILHGQVFVMVSLYCCSFGSYYNRSNNKQYV